VDRSLEGDLTVKKRGLHGPRGGTVPSVHRPRTVPKARETPRRLCHLRKRGAAAREVQSPEGRIPRALHPERRVGGGMGSKTSREPAGSEDGRCRVRKAREYRTHFAGSAVGRWNPTRETVGRARPARSVRRDPGGERRPREDVRVLLTIDAARLERKHPVGPRFARNGGRTGNGQPMRRYRSSRARL
jgi:hypothetical protein